MQSFSEQLEKRNNQIVSLQTQLLHIDYRYTKILQKIKTANQQIIEQKDQAIEKLIQENKVLKKQEKKVQKKIEQILQRYQRTQEELEEMILYTKNKQTQFKQYEATKREIKQLMLKLRKTQVKYDEFSRENAKLKSINEKLKQRLKKQTKNRKQLEQFIKEEVVRTEQQFADIQRNVKEQICTNTKQIFGQNMLNSEMGLQTIKMQKFPILNEWETDMKALKNCIEYGQTYLLQFDSSSFNHEQSYKTLNSSNNLKEKYEKEIQNYKTQIRLSNQKLTQFIDELNSIKLNRNITFQAQTQTITQDEGENQLLLQSLIEGTTKLKRKNSLFLEIIQIFSFLALSLCENLQYSQHKMQYYQVFQVDYFKKPKYKPNKLRALFRGVFFIQLLKKKINKTKKQIPQQVRILSRKSPSHRILVDIFRKSLQNMENLQIQRLKESYSMGDIEILQKVLNITSYGQLKLKKHETGLMDFLWKFKYSL